MSGEYDVSGWASDLAHQLAYGEEHRRFIAQVVRETIDTLADPHWRGSEEVLKAIMRKRAAK